MKLPSFSGLTFRSFAIQAPTIPAPASAALACAALASTALAGGIRNVDQPAQGIYQDMQAAVAAAADGDTLLVGAGHYFGFTLDGKALRIIGAPGQLVQLITTVEIDNLSSSQTVVLAGLEITGTSVFPVAQPALRMQNVAANVRIQSCQLIGGLGGADQTYGGSGGDGLSISACPRVVIASSTLLGGVGYTGHGGDCAAGGDGGHGIHAINSTLAVYRSSCIGVDGGGNYDYGGNGGHGALLESSAMFASGTLFQGGDGGDTLDNFFLTQAGNGGDGIHLADAAAHAGLLDDTFIPGNGGKAHGLPAHSGAPGQPIAGPGTTQLFTGPQRTLTASTRIVSDQASLGLTIKGAPGDQVFLVTSTRAGFFSPPNTVGPFLVHVPALVPLDPIGVVPASGVLSVTVPVVPLGASEVQRIDYLQAGCLDASGQHLLTGSVLVEVLDPSRPPDCDGNLVNDYLDTITGAVPDCDHNLQPDVCDPDCDGNGTPDACEIANGTQHDCNGNHIPDECELAAGTAFDCNGNGVLDSCDIDDGTSLDTDHNGIPDECEANTIWYVDASAPPGGNGSAASPFDSLAPAFAAAISGDTIRVLDGVYTGAQNQNLDFGPRNLVVQSVNGAANCVIDEQLVGRAFILAGHQTAQSRIEGFTIRNGQAPGTGAGGAITTGSYGPNSAQSVTIRNCVFVSCNAYSGGAVNAAYDAIIQACVFRSCSAGNGGAISMNSAHVSRCLFESNSSPNGGAILVAGTADAAITHCVFLTNTSSDRGGAIKSRSYQSTTFVDDCLFAGNTAATYGGGIEVDFEGSNNLATCKITQCTFSGNSAQFGGAVHCGTCSIVTIDNAILWGDSAPNGSELSQVQTLGPIAHLDVRYCDVLGGQAGLFHTGTGVVTWGSGNLSVDPMFANPSGADGNPLTFDDNDYRLSLASRCIDAANNAAIPSDLNDIDNDGDKAEPTPLDLDLMPRRQDIPSVPDTGSGQPPIVDMGCYEKQP
jgi:predicted outer membrane repeat protein